MISLRVCLFKGKESERIIILVFCYCSGVTLLVIFLGSTALLGADSYTLSVCYLSYSLYYILTNSSIITSTRLFLISIILVYCYIHKFILLSINWSDLPDPNHHRIRIVDAKKA
jgi:hypothetical protein